MDNFELDMLVSDGYVVSSEYDFDTSKISKVEAGGFRKPIVMETYLEESSLVEAIRRGDRLGSQYGEVMICKIVPVGTLAHVKGIIARGRMNMIEDGGVDNGENGKDDDHTLIATSVSKLLDPDFNAMDDLQIQISARAINAASLFLIDIWYNLREVETDGLFDWLSRETREAIEIHDGEIGTDAIHLGHNGMVISVKFIRSGNILVLNVNVLD